MNKLKLTAAVLALLGTVAARATTYTEIPDAGQTLGTAQVLDAGTSQVVGSTAGDADLFLFGWGGGNFYANTVGTSYSDSSTDAQLFLFDSNGVGIQSNDDGIAYAGPAYLQVAGLAAGTYYIGISSYDLDPYSASGLIFPTYPYEPLYGPSNLDPLEGFTGTAYHSGNYVINFGSVTSDGTPIDDNPTSSVPDSGSSIGLLGLGLATLAMIRRRK